MGVIKMGNLAPSGNKNNQEENSDLKKLSNDELKNFLQKLT